MHLDGERFGMIHLNVSRSHHRPQNQYLDTHTHTHGAIQKLYIQPKQPNFLSNRCRGFLFNFPSVAKSLTKAIWLDTQDPQILLTPCNNQVWHMKRSVANGLVSTSKLLTCIRVYALPPICCPTISSVLDNRGGLPYNRPGSFCTGRALH